VSDSPRRGGVRRGPVLTQRAGQLGGALQASGCPLTLIGGQLDLPALQDPPRGVRIGQSDGELGPVDQRLDVDGRARQQGNGDLVGRATFLAGRCTRLAAVTKSSPDRRAGRAAAGKNGGP
jgi:hypothetical protein